MVPVFSYILSAKHAAGIVLVASTSLHSVSPVFLQINIRGMKLEMLSHCIRGKVQSSTGKSHHYETIDYYTLVKLNKF